MFEDRFGTAAALRKMGADITCKGKDAWVRGVYPLKGARVKALDLRGGAALAVAALGAEGKTVIEDCSHIVRGYDRLKAAGSDLRSPRIFWDLLQEDADTKQYGQIPGL